ncbi:IS91 family transposase [Pseudoalteromonas xiamenensis]|uniref:IS91 family transposase n=1 Tax=Pseudoalteromonas xiamenensis TaxID=882626 RepID=UPI001FCC6468|nr:IS91 family transposase [Pseudoalteromonas xiamenensis]
MSEYHIADILHEGLASYRQHHTISYQQIRACQHIQSCRTGKLGYQEWQCDDCAEVERIGCSCRDRHCPRCQGYATQQWITKQQARLLPCRYFHLVFTLPHELNPLAQHQPSMVYQSLFQAAWATLTQFAAKKGHGQLGMTCVLHTWGQTLSQHIHLHCLIPAGSIRQGRWCTIDNNYLYPVKALSRVFRGKMLAALYARNKDVVHVSTPTEWCVYSKACLTYSPYLVSYLARYTRKGMMSEHRLVAVDEQGVSFSYRDYKDEDKQKVMQLSRDEFIRRYLLHVLPKGLMRIRHYGFLANASYKRVQRIVRSIEQEAQSSPQRELQPPTLPCWTCKVCGHGRLSLKSVITAKRHNPDDVTADIRLS